MNENCGRRGRHEMRILFAARAMHRMAGGVERMIATVMHAMVARGHEVDLLTWDLDGAEPFYPMPPSVRWHRLNLGDHERKAGVYHLLRRMMAVRKIVRRRRPQVIVSFQDGAFRALRAYALGLGVPVVAAERNAPTRFDHTKSGRKPPVIYNSFRLAKVVIIQCESYRELYPGYLHDRIDTIPNPIFPTKSAANPDRPDSRNRFRLLSVGRLVYQKNYQSLITAFARLAGDFPDWELTIIGEGEDRPKLEAMISAENLGAVVSLPGTTTAIDECYKGAHLFCLPSRWEGFPNVLGEAMAHCLPAVGFAGCAGVRDLVTPEQTGLLAAGNGDDESLAAALARLMSDRQRRRVMGAAACDAIKPYAPDAIFDLWEETLRKAAKQ